MTDERETMHYPTQGLSFSELETLMTAVWEAADSDWKASAETVITSLAATKMPFTSDDVWDVLDRLPCATKTRAALGPVMARLANQGVIRKTGRFVRSRRRTNHHVHREWIGIVND